MNLPDWRSIDDGREKTPYELHDLTRTSPAERDRLDKNDKVKGVSRKVAKLAKKSKSSGSKVKA